MISAHTNTLMGRCLFRGVQVKSAIYIAERPNVSRNIKCAFRPPYARKRDSTNDPEPEPGLQIVSVVLGGYNGFLRYN